MKHILTSALVLAAGCTMEVAPELELGEIESAISKCPDPNNCTVSNGGGVYTEELGEAGIGAHEFMITHFINNGTGGAAYVTLEGRYFHPNPNPALSRWRTSTGSIVSANYNGQTGYDVRSVSESFTTPTWVIARPGETPISVTGSQIQLFQLVVDLEDATAVKRYTLDWSAYHAETMPNTMGNTTIRMANMSWKLTTGNQWNQYCKLADGTTTDPVVFQQGIAVNPVTAAVTRNDNFVTLSCRHGGPATVRLWGYAYRPNPNLDTKYFDAGLHMKRASYCGDYTFYTRANTEISIWDDAGIQGDPNQPMSASEIEASWTTTGARCVNTGNLRRPNARWPANQSGSLFTGACDNGPPIPECLTLTAADYLREHEAPPSP